MNTKKPKTRLSTPQPQPEEIRHHNAIFAGIVAKYSKLVPGGSAREALNESEDALLSRILWALEQGYDARDLLGIPHKAGRVPTAIPYHRAAAIHYWMLRDVFSEECPSEKQAVGAVADLWGMSDAQVRKIARQYRDVARRYIRETIPVAVDTAPTIKTLFEREKLEWESLPVEKRQREEAPSSEDAARFWPSDEGIAVLRQIVQRGGAGVGARLAHDALAILEADRAYRARIFAVIFERNELARMYRQRSVTNSGGDQ